MSDTDNTPQRPNKKINDNWRDLSSNTNKNLIGSGGYWLGLLSSNNSNLGNTKSLKNQPTLATLMSSLIQVSASVGSCNAAPSFYSPPDQAPMLITCSFPK